MWGEQEPAPTGPVALEIVGGVADPIPEPAIIPPVESWARATSVIERHREALYHLVRAPLVAPSRSGSGVLLVGGGKYWPGVVVGIKMLRDTGCTLPVQVWHRGATEPVRLSDLDGIADVTVHDLTTLEPSPRILRGWESKTLAMLACGWEKIFFHDADAYCVADPAPLLDTLSRAEPFLYWEDTPGAFGATVWPVWGMANSPVPPVQGGHLAIHMTHFWREFVIAHWLNPHSDFSYFHQYGDQDSWRVALSVTGGRYKLLGPAVWEEMAFVCSLDGSPRIVHRCQSKMIYPEEIERTDHHSNRRLDRLPGEARAWEHWESLLASRPAEDVFGRIYRSTLWATDGTSGAGSTPEQARPYLELVNSLIELSGWKRIVDLGSGDGYVASQLRAPEVVAVECHAPHVKRLARDFPDRQWLNLDLDRDREKLPSGEVAFLKDVLHHWPNSLVLDWLKWARSCGKWRWLITTQDRHQERDGQDCSLGGYRGLDLTMEPLRGLGLMPFSEYLHKSVLLLRLDD